MIGILLLVTLCVVVAFLMSFFSVRAFGCEQFLSILTYFVLGGAALAWVFTIIVTAIVYAYK